MPISLCPPSFPYQQFGDNFNDNIFLFRWFFRLNLFILFIVCGSHMAQHTCGGLGTSARSHVSPSVWVPRISSGHQVAGTFTCWAPWPVPEHNFLLAALTWVWTELHVICIYASSSSRYTVRIKANHPSPYLFPFSPFFFFCWGLNSGPCVC